MVLLALLIAVLGMFVAAVIILVFVGLRNNLMQQRNELGRVLLNLDQLLKQRRDELPRLAGTCRSYFRDGSALLDSLTAARIAEQKAAGPEAKASAARDLQRALQKLFAAADRNAALELDTGYRRVKKSILGLDERIAAEQARFNQQAGAFNARLGRLPASVAARAASLKRQALFEASGIEPSSGSSSGPEPSGRVSSSA